MLQVEDSESDAALVVRVLEKAGYAVHAERVESADEVREALPRGWDVIIADYNLPQFDAFAALSVVREYDEDLPFLVLSGSISEARAVQLMRAGAQDYVLKDSIVRLVPAITREIRQAENRRERREAEERLRDREEWLVLATSVAQLGLFDHYPGTGKIIVSEIARRHLGMTGDSDIDFDGLFRGVHPDDSAQVGELVRKAFDPQGDGDFTAEYRTTGVADQVERFLSVRGKVFFDGDHKPNRFVGVTSDMTARKQLEGQFLQAQKLEGLGRLAGGVAHDFNNLLTVINGYSQMTLDTIPADDPLREGLEEILKAGTRANFLTRQLLAFSRRRATRVESIVLNELLGDIRKMLERLVGEDVKLIFAPNSAAGVIHADAGHLEQVVMNLVVNARDAMPGGGKVTIETSRLDIDERFAESHLEVAPGPYAVLTVSDTGTGMSDHVKAHLFEPFFTTKEEGKGTGLGLSTVYGIVKQCGGSISVTSEVGQGTQFRILLPIAAPDAEQTASPNRTKELAGTECIIVAEDQSNVRSFITALLRERGYSVLECDDGREVIALARSHPAPIQLLIADVVMPELSGPELARQFAGCRPGVPVLYMSGYSELAAASVEETAYFIEKPFSPTAILTRVREILDRAKE